MGSTHRSGGTRILVRYFERVFRMMRHAFSLVGTVFRHESVATSDLSHSSDRSVSPGGWSGSACVVQDSPHVGPSNRVTVPRNHVAGRHACLSPGHKRPAAPMAHQRGVKPACLWSANHAACAHRDRSGDTAQPFLIYPLITWLAPALLPGHLS